MYGLCDVSTNCPCIDYTWPMPRGQRLCNRERAATAASVDCIERIYQQRVNTASGLASEFAPCNRGYYASELYPRRGGRFRDLVSPSYKKRDIPYTASVIIMEKSMAITVYVLIVVRKRRELGPFKR